MVRRIIRFTHSFTIIPINNRSARILSIYNKENKEMNDILKNVKKSTIASIVTITVFRKIANMVKKMLYKQEYERNGIVYTTNGGDEKTIKLDRNLIHKAPSVISDKQFTYISNIYSNENLLLHDAMLYDIMSMPTSILNIITILDESTTHKMFTHATTYKYYSIISSKSILPAISIYGDNAKYIINMNSNTKLYDMLGTIGIVQPDTEREGKIAKILDMEIVGVNSDIHVYTIESYARNVIPIEYTYNDNITINGSNMLEYIVIELEKDVEKLSHIPADKRTNYGMSGDTVKKIAITTLKSILEVMKSAYDITNGSDDAFYIISNTMKPINVGIEKTKMILEELNKTY